MRMFLLSLSYKNKNFWHDALLEIASHVGVEKGEGGEKKIKYVQTNLTRELKKEKKSKGTGTGSAETYKSKWYCFDDPHVSLRQDC